MHTSIAVPGGVPWCDVCVGHFSVAQHSVLIVVDLSVEARQAQAGNRLFCFSPFAIMERWPENPGEVHRRICFQGGGFVPPVSPFFVMCAKWEFACLCMSDRC